MKKAIPLLLALLLLAGGAFLFLRGGAARSAPRGENGALQGDTLRLRHARNFRLVDFGDFKVLSTLVPWKGAPRAYSMVLARSDSLVPEELRALPFFRVPARRVVARGAAQARELARLGELDALVGIGSARESSLDEIRLRVLRGQVAEVGGDAAFDEEIAVSLEPDLLLTWATGSSADVHDRLLDLDVPVALEAAWMEETPLGRAEWVRFYAAFFDKDSLATALFDEVESGYGKLKELAAGVSRRPTVMVGSPYGGAWHTAGGRSWVARIVDDAGGIYLWRDDESAGSTARTLESVLERCAGADLWINGADSWNSLADVVREDGRLSLFRPWRERAIWNNNAARTGQGLNVFWEETPSRPDLLLADLVHIFHPGLLLDHQSRWYRRLR